MLNRLRYLRWYYWGRWWIKNRINRKARKGEKIKINIGSGKDFGEENAWILTNLPHFDITKVSDWKFFFSKHKIDNLLAEHVLEHLTEEDAEKVLKLSFQYLKSGGCFRIAVPDGFHSNPKYIEYVKPCGIGPGCDDHKVLWNCQTITKAGSAKKFTVNLLEYYNEEGKFQIKKYCFSNGFIIRSKKNNFIQMPIENYTSLIVDLKK